MASFTSYQSGGGALQGLHARFPAVRPAGYFEPENVAFLRKTLAHVAAREFMDPVRGNPIHFTVSDADMARIMQRVAEERIESIPRMNQRVVMYIMNDYRTHQIARDRAMRWEENYRFADKLYDPTTGRAGFDQASYHPPNRLGLPKVGGTLRFYDPFAGSAS